MLLRSVLCSLLALMLLSLSATAQTSPPFSGTIFIEPDLIVRSDSSTFLAATYSGRGERTVFDRRVERWVVVNAYLYTLTFADGRRVEAQVNPEFGSEEAGMEQAAFYGPRIGQLPIALRRDLDALWIHRGRQPFGGGFRSLLIHTEQAGAFERAGILEETLIHEAAHTSLDAEHARSPGWIEAQAADSTFISIYARDHPTREDIAESFVTYVAIRHRGDRLSQELADSITATIPNRLAYFDGLNLDLRPVAEVGPIEPDPEPEPEPESHSVPVGLVVGPNPFRTATTLRLALAVEGSVSLDVLDMRGRRVATLASGLFPEGLSIIEWAAGDLASGTYVIRARAAGTIVTRTVSILR